MSQKKLKKLRKLEILQSRIGNNKETVFEPVLGIRQIIKQNWKFLFFLSLGIFLLYLNSLRGDFVSDDYASIPQNTMVTNFSFMFQGFVSMSNWFLATISGIVNPMFYHLFNLILYILICVLVFVLTTIIFNKNVAKISIILFAVLPIHVEAVSWISGKPYLFNAFFVLLSLIFFVLYLRTANKKYFWILLCLLPLTFFAERVRSLSFLFLAILYLVSFKEKNKIKINLGKVLLISVIAISVLGVILWPLISNRIGNVNSGYNGSGGIFYNPFFQYPTAMAKYLQLALIPADLTLYHTMYFLPDWLNWLVFLSYLGAVGYFFFKDKKMFFTLAFIFVATAPSMAPVKVSWLVAERYLFLGSFGFCVFLVLFFQRFGKKLELPFFVLFLTVIGIFSARVYFRNIDWRTNHNLWVNTCQVSPNSHNAWNNIGDDYDKLAQYDNAIKGFTQSTVVKPNYADAFHNRANIFYKIGRYDLASDSYETALSFGPQLYQSYFSLIQIDLIEKRYDLAMNHLNRLDKVKPNDPQVAYLAAVIYANAGQKDQAIIILEQILKVIPNFKEAVSLLSQLKK